MRASMLARPAGLLAVLAAIGFASTAAFAQSDAQVKQTIIRAVDRRLSRALPVPLQRDAQRAQLRRPQRL